MSFAVESGHIDAERRPVSVTPLAMRRGTGTSLSVVALPNLSHCQPLAG
jgi:hypothetical protein